MKRIPIFIDDDVDQSIRQLAAEDGRPFMALIREALFDYAQRRGAALEPRVGEPQASISDPAVSERFLKALESIQASVPDDVTQEEIDAEIDAVAAEVRAERWQRLQQPAVTHD